MVKHEANCVWNRYGAGCVKEGSDVVIPNQQHPGGGSFAAGDGLFPALFLVTMSCVVRVW